MKNLLFILRLLPLLLPAIKAVEAAITTPKSGPTKLSMVLDAVAIAADASGGVIEGVQAKDAVAITTSLVNGIVKTMNASGDLAK